MSVLNTVDPRTRHTNGSIFFVNLSILGRPWQLNTSTWRLPIFSSKGRLRSWKWLELRNISFCNSSRVIQRWGYKWCGITLYSFWFELPDICSSSLEFNFSNTWLTFFAEFDLFLSFNCLCKSYSLMLSSYRVRCVERLNF